MTHNLGNGAHESRAQVRYGGSLWEVLESRAAFRHEVSFHEILIKPLEVYAAPRWVLLEECDLCG